MNQLAFIVLVGSAATLLLVAPIGMQSTYDFGLVRCLYGFMFGVLVRELWRWSRPRVGTVGEVAIAAGTCAAVVLLPVGAPALLVTPVFAVAVWIFASEDGALSRVMRLRPFQLLGAWSYSIYMVHLVIALGMLVAAMIATRRGWPVFAEVNGIVTIVGPAWFTVLAIGLYASLVVIVARATYRFVELPGQRLFRHMSRASS